MLIKAKVLTGYMLESLDGEMGSVGQFYFDDRYWAVRYLVANTGNWLTSRMVLISPYSLKSIDQERGLVSVQLTKKEIEDGPSLDRDKPVSCQYEGLYNEYYGFPSYWGGPYMWGGDPYIERDRSKWGLAASEASEWDRHLRGSREVSGNHLSALDGEIGYVDDFIIDAETWAIRYLVVATNNWWPGQRVLISPKWIENVSWEEREFEVSLSRRAIRAAPEYTDMSQLTRDYESDLYEHYNRDGYWWSARSFAPGGLVA